VAYYENSPAQPVVEDEMISNGGGRALIALSGEGQQGNLFMDGTTSFVISDFEEEVGRQRIEMEVNGESNLFLELGDFAIGGVEIELADNKDIVFSAQGACLALQVVNDTATLSCYSAGPDCTYDLDGSTATLDVRGKANVNVAQAQVLDSQPIAYEDAFAYYEMIKDQSFDPPMCVMAIIDADGDSYLDQEDIDLCIGETGQVQGCPDSDGDLVPEPLDSCPTVAGLASYNGCPPPDSDRDGLRDNLDACPNLPGPSDNNGCPRDSDRDGVLDDDDRCLNEPGVPENGGCPAVPPRRSPN